MQSPSLKCQGNVYAAISQIMEEEPPSKGGGKCISVKWEEKVILVGGERKQLAKCKVLKAPFRSASPLWKLTNERKL